MARREFQKRLPLLIYTTGSTLGFLRRIRENNYPSDLDIAILSAKYGLLNATD
jgi:hypothetical protein